MTVTLQDIIDHHRAEADVCLQKPHVRELHNAMADTLDHLLTHLQCAYCGVQVPSAEIAAHIEACPKHPISMYREIIATVAAECERFADAMTASSLAARTSLVGRCGEKDHEEDAR